MASTAELRCPDPRGSDVKDCADLEIALRRWEGGGYAMTLRFTTPARAAETGLGTVRPVLIDLPLQDLLDIGPDPLAYGQQLAAHLFQPPEVLAMFGAARGNAAAEEVPLRLRLFIDSSAPELHGIAWETLCDPSEGTPLFSDESILFSRYLSSFDWRPVGLRRHGELRALIAVASPENLADFAPNGGPLAPINVDDEIDRARWGLGTIASMTLARPEAMTLDALSERLREGYDILYFVCHGALIRGRPHLWLEDAQRQADVMPADDLVVRLRGLPERPRLVVLCAAQRAGATAHSTDPGVLAALGPRLAEAGIPAVLAIHGNVTVATMAEFMPCFFVELRRDGQIDRAVTTARAAVRERLDWWMPVLTMRLKTGRLWSAPGFAMEKSESEAWPALVSNIRNGRCVPIIGSGLSERALGTRRELAQSWATEHRFPMESHRRESLPQIAQHLAVHVDFMVPRTSFKETLLRALVQRVPTNDVNEPHRILAELPLPIFITTDPTRLLEEALNDAGKSPQTEFCRWNDGIKELPTIYEKEPAYRPDSQKPLVYHLFGILEEPDSLVLTEDDHFQFLIGWTRNKELIPKDVRRALADGGLTFLGFHIDDWSFRVVFHGISTHDMVQRRRRHAPMTVQIDPEEGRILEPERAAAYLEKYAVPGAGVHVYWGSTEDFTRELQKRWHEAPP